MFNFIKKRKKDKEEYEIFRQKFMKTRQDFNDIDEIFTKYFDLDEYNYDNNKLSSMLADDNIIMFIYRTLDDMKKTMVVSSYLNQIDMPISIIKEGYSIDDNYVNELIDEILPALKVEVHKYITEVLPNIKNPFFPDYKPNFEPEFEELSDRIEYYIEVKRNRDKINNDNRLSSIKEELINNQQLLLLLNAFDTKDALIIASNLGIVSVNEDEVHGLYSFDENRFNDLLTGGNMAYIEEILIKRIEKLDNIPIERSYFDYRGLSNEYKQLLNEIENTKEYIFGGRKK